MLYADSRNEEAVCGREGRRSEATGEVCRGARVHSEYAGEQGKISSGSPEEDNRFF